MQFFDSLINLFFYKKIAVVSWNIVKYNIFSSTGGPDPDGSDRDGPRVDCPDVDGPRSVTGRPRR